jgi:hypothetical protein
MVVGRDGGRQRREELAAKLRLTAAALGCTTGKELCARFRAVNPATEFDLERSYKWAQGRALPRSAQVYADWARLIDTGRTADWMMHCGPSELLEELSVSCGIAPDELRRRAGLLPAEADQGGASLGPGHYLGGAYACYSFAWSRYFRGKLIRGGLVVEPGRGAAAPVATYSESITVGRCRLRGPMQLHGRSIFVDVRDATSQQPLFFTVYMPAPPASVLVGLMSGATLVGPDQEPSVSRVVMIKVPAGPDLLEQTNRYMDATAGGLTSDLASLGLPVADDDEIGTLVLRCLDAGERPGFDQVLREETSPLVSALDRLFITSTVANEIGNRNVKT